MPVVDQILDLLRNGEWHGVSELVDKSGVGERKVGLIVDFLRGFGFLESDARVGRVRLSPALLLFLRRVEDLERAEARGGGREKKMMARGALSFLRVVRLSVIGF